MERKSKGLSFSCGRTDDDPWSYVSNTGILDAETRLLILENIYKEPKTVTQLANEFLLSTDMLWTCSMWASFEKLTYL
jgi:hypothetical protein